MLKSNTILLISMWVFAACGVVSCQSPKADAVSHTSEPAAGYYPPGFELDRLYDASRLPRTEFGVWCADGGKLGCKLVNAERDGKILDSEKIADVDIEISEEGVFIRADGLFQIKTFFEQHAWSHEDERYISFDLVGGWSYIVKRSEPDENYLLNKKERQLIVFWPKPKLISPFNGRVVYSITHQGFLIFKIQY